LWKNNEKYYKYIDSYDIHFSREKGEELVKVFGTQSRVHAYDPTKVIKRRVALQLLFKISFFNDQKFFGGDDIRSLFFGIS